MLTEVTYGERARNALRVARCVKKPAAFAELKQGAACLGGKCAKVTKVALISLRSFGQDSENGFTRSCSRQVFPTRRFGWSVASCLSSVAASGWSRRDNFAALPNAIRRHSRLPACATADGD